MATSCTGSSATTSTRSTGTTTEVHSNLASGTYSKTDTVSSTTSASHSKSVASPTGVATIVDWNSSTMSTLTSFVSSTLSAFSQTISENSGRLRSLTHSIPRTRPNQQPSMLAQTTRWRSSPKTAIPLCTTPALSSNGSRRSLPASQHSNRTFQRVSGQALGSSAPDCGARYAALLIPRASSRGTEAATARATFHVAGSACLRLAQAARPGEGQACGAVRVGMKGAARSIPPGRSKHRSERSE